MLNVEQDMMESLPHYKKKYEEAKKINVYFVPGIDEETQEETYYYAIASAQLAEQMADCLQKGYIPHFAVIVEKGVGKPSKAVKDKIKDYYGFDHDFHASNDNSLLMKRFAEA